MKKKTKIIVNNVDDEIKPLKTSKYEQSKVDQNRLKTADHITP
jgi:hypothetical protein